jgi:hypothetical protein
VSNSTQCPEISVEDRDMKPGAILILNAKTDCHHCQVERDKFFFTMRNYLRTTPKSTVWEVHEKTGISLTDL